MSISDSKTYVCFCDEENCNESYDDLAPDEEEFIGQLESAGWKIVDRDHCYCPKHITEGGKIC